MRFLSAARRLKVETLIMRRQLGYWPNLLRPRTFNERVVRRKLAPAPAEWSVLADKVAAREVVARRAGPEYLVPLVGVYADAFSVPPEGRVVVKAAHASGLNTLITEPTQVDWPSLRLTWVKWLSSEYGATTHEDWYAAIPRRLIVEQLLRDDVHGVPLDFKCFVFRGRVEYVQVDFSRFTSHARTFYDRHWQPQPWGLVYPHGPTLPRPRPLDALIELAECLSGGMDFVRVDLYCVNDAALYFGEFTFAPEAGWGRFSSYEADRLLGSCWP